MSFIRERLIGNDITFNSTVFVSEELASINLASYASQTHLETNPMHVVVYWNVTEEITNFIGTGFIHHFTVLYDKNFSGGNYIYTGIGYDETCPVRVNTIVDFNDFELGAEGLFLSFVDGTMSVFASLRSPNGVDLRIRTYIELYVNSDVQ
jgi:hypothetical protein